MRGSTRTLAVRLLAILAVTGALCLAAPGPASAGGPTSVLLASPFTGSAAGLYYTDDAYGRLQDLLGGPDLPAGPTDAPSAAAGSPYVTATWLIHDVSAWRIDRIFPAGADVWVVTQTSTGDGPLTGEGMYPGQTGNAAAIWHRPTDPAALTALLAELGLVTGPADAAGATSLPAPVAVTQDTTAAGPATGWLLAIGGLVAGVVIGVTAVRLSAARRRTSDSTAEPARMAPMA